MAQDHDPPKLRLAYEVQEKETRVGPRPRHQRQRKLLELPATPPPSTSRVPEALRWWDWDKDKNGRSTLPENFNLAAYQTCDRISAEMETCALLHFSEPCTASSGVGKKMRTTRKRVQGEK